jgi:predicted RNase H-like nuclease (RuvC/YqgF family)
MADWDKAKPAALKVLGDGAEVPDLPDTVKKASDEFEKANNEFKKSREDCEAKLLALQNSNDAMRNAVKQFEAKIEKSDFKLDSKNKEALKKIQKARKLLTDTLNVAIKGLTDNDNMLDELDKHLIQLGKYKPKPGPS